MSDDAGRRAGPAEPNSGTAAAFILHIGPDNSVRIDFEGARGDVLASVRLTADVADALAANLDCETRRALWEQACKDAKKRRH